MKLIKGIKRRIKSFFLKLSSPAKVFGTPGVGYQCLIITSNKYNIQCQLIRKEYTDEEYTEERLIGEKYLKNIGYVILDMDNRLINNDEILDDIYSSWRQLICKR